MKISAAILMTIAVFAAAFIKAPEVSAESYCGKLEYIICGDSAVITGYENSPVTLDIPCRIDGKAVSAVRENAFYKCGSLKSVTLPDTVTSIGHHAFSGCTALESAVINGSITLIDEGCFSGCTSLCKISLPDSIREIGKNSFYKCINLGRLELPESLEVIDENAFCGCGSLESIRLPNRLLKVGDKAFYACTKLTEVHIPDSTAELGSRAFGYIDGARRKVNGFTLTGGRSSLGKAYAADNGFGYKAADTCGTAEIPTVPTTVAILSGAGLMFLFILSKMRHLRFRYEYER